MELSAVEVDSVSPEPKDSRSGEESSLPVTEKPCVETDVKVVHDGADFGTCTNPVDVVSSSDQVPNQVEALSCLNEILSEVKDVVQASSQSDSEGAVLKCVSETMKKLVDEVINVKDDQMESISSTKDGHEVESSIKASELKERLVNESKSFDYEVKYDRRMRDDEDRDSSIDSESDSSSSSSSSDNDESSVVDDSDVDEETLDEILSDKRGKSKIGGNSGTVRTKGELGLDDLPLIQDLKISVDKKDIQHVGRVLTIVDTLVVVQSLEGAPALNLDSILFFDGGEPLGQIFDVFGPVIRPLYSVRFNTADDIKAKNVTLGSSVFYAPMKTEFTSFVFAEQLRRMKGSDASWENNNEPPAECLDYSDDEQEKQAKVRLKNRNRKEPNWNEQQQPRPKMQTKRPNWKQNRAKHQQNYATGTTPVAVLRPSSFSPRFQQTMPPPPSPFAYSRPPFYQSAGFRASPIQNSNPFYNVQPPSFPGHVMFMPPINLLQPPPPPPPPPNPSQLSLSVAQSPRTNIWMLRPTTSQQSNNQSYSNATSSSDQLPNPFRSQSNAPSNTETLNVPRFPPSGFVPRM